MRKGWAVAMVLLVVAMMVLPACAAVPCCRHCGPMHSQMHVAPTAECMHCGEMSADAPVVLKAGAADGKSGLVQRVSLALDAGVMAARGSVGRSVVTAGHARVLPVLRT